MNVCNHYGSSLHVLCPGGKLVSTQKTVLFSVFTKTSEGQGIWQILRLLLMSSSGKKKKIVAMNVFFNWRHMENHRYMKPYLKHSLILVRRASAKLVVDLQGTPVVLIL